MTVVLADSAETAAHVDPADGLGCREALARYARAGRRATVERYVASPDNPAAALLRDRDRLGRDRYRIALVGPAATTDPRVDELLRRIQMEEQLADVQLGRHAHNILVKSLFGQVAGLLSALAPSRGATAATSQSVTTVLRSTDRELTALSRFVRASARRTALGLYLAGLLIGAVVGCVLVWLTGRSPMVDHYIANKQLAICLACGAIGAVISVMARISRGERLDVDVDKSKTITVLAGSFRPVIGAVFGGVLFLLVSGHILPLQVPGPGQACLFFAGLAFLAGFTERWAQDIIVTSAPKVR